MKTTSIFLMISLMLAVSVVQAQKALPIQIIKFLSGLSIPQDCSGSYHLCTIQKDKNGLLSVKDAGNIDERVTQVKEDLKELGFSIMNSQTSSAAPAMPSEAQMAQMQQSAANIQGMTQEQAMKMAQQMSHQHAMPQANNTDLMDEFGKAQNAAAELATAVGELTNKATQLAGETQSKIDEVERTGSCKGYKVKGADLALPKCSCVKEADLDFYNRRIAIENNFLEQLNGLLQSYMAKIKEQVASIDKIESDLKYGDAISISAMKTQVIGVQQQALSSVGTVLDLFSQNVQKAGEEYAGVVNVNNGHLSEPCQ